MHEFSLAQGLIKQLQQLAEAHGVKQIVTVRVEIGRLAGIVTDSFAFGFEVLARENKVTEHAVLEITEIEPQYRCLDCHSIFPSNEGSSACPGCASSRIIPEGGDDLILSQVEME